MSEAPTSYEVSHTGLVRSEVRRLIAAAATPERARAILTAFRELDRLLRIYPQFGDPIIDLTQESGQVCIGTVPPLAARYGICEERRLVIVTVLRLLPEANS